ncbi:protein immune deficiency [Uranotaenia lowii]|uniref:protein immune deficiency n=1 Tax=Uranotaenia lowii TaxID=190385 RepID=UPI00247AB2CC|nr:protein immune deficiency [Uranotaenia lowii]
MAKFKNIFTSIFSKSSKLETDAAIISASSEEYKPQVTNAQNNTDQSQSLVNNTEVALVTRATSSQLSPVAQPQDQLQPATANIVNNIQNNTLSAPQTAISNSAGIQVFKINNASNVHIGHKITINSPTSGENPADSIGQQRNYAKLRLSETIRLMMDCEDELDNAMMDAISRHLGYQWKSFARCLEYSEGQIQAFECDNPTLSEQIYHFVLDWVRNVDDPSIGRMTKLLWENKHKETVYHMKVVWKKRRPTHSEQNVTL